MGSDPISGTVDAIGADSTPAPHGRAWTWSRLCLGRGCRRHRHLRNGSRTRERWQRRFLPSWHGMGELGPSPQSSALHPSHRPDAYAVEGTEHPRAGGQPSQPQAPPATVPIPCPTAQPPSPPRTPSHSPPGVATAWGHALMTTVLNFVPRQLGNMSLTPQAPWDGCCHAGKGQGALPPSACPPLRGGEHGKPFPGGTVPSSPAARSTAGNIRSAPSFGSTTSAIFQATALEPDQGMRSGPDPAVPSALCGAPRSRAGVEGHPWVPTLELRTWLPEPPPALSIPRGWRWATAGTQPRATPAWSILHLEAI